MAALDRGLPDRALVLKPNWIEEILAGRKLWELRGENLHLRGIVALASKGELFGEVTIEHAMLVGIRDAEGTLLAPAGNEQNFLALPANMDKHRVKDQPGLCLGHVRTPSLCISGALSPPSGSDQIRGPHEAGRADCRPHTFCGVRTIVLRGSSCQKTSNHASSGRRCCQTGWRGGGAG